MKYAMVLCLSVASCGDLDGDIQIGRDVRNAQQESGCSTYTEVFPQISASDLLLVVDGSGSMADVHDAMIANIAELVDAGTAANLQYHIGVANSDLGPEEGKLRYCPGAPPWVSSFADRAAQLDALTCALGNLETDFSDIVETPLAAAAAAVRSALQDGTNAGFLQTGARLSIVVITDEADQSPGTVDDWLREIRGLVTTRAEFGLITVAGPTPDGCATADANALGSAVTAGLDGLFLSICDPMDTTLRTVGERAFAREGTFTLAAVPDEASLVVEVCAQGGGQPVDCVPAGDTDWSQSERALTFAPWALPAGGSLVRVSYTQCSDR